MEAGALVVGDGALVVVLGATEVVEGDGAATGVSLMAYTYVRHAPPQVAVDPAHFCAQSVFAVFAVASGAAEPQ